LIQRYKLEYSMSFASAVGVLQFKAHLLMQEAQQNSEDEAVR
jgi:hypothetical protein